MSYQLNNQPAPINYEELNYHDAQPQAHSSNDWHQSFVDTQSPVIVQEQDFVASNDG